MITEFDSSECQATAERREWSSCLSLPHKELAGLVYDALTALVYLYNTSSDDTTAGNLERLNKTKASFAGLMVCVTLSSSTHASFFSFSPREKCVILT